MPTSNKENEAPSTIQAGSQKRSNRDAGQPMSQKDARDLRRVSRLLAYSSCGQGS